MFSIRIDKVMLPMKLHYFLYLGSISCISVYLPTIAKQMGYSPEMVGYLFMYLSTIALLVKPLFGFIVDKFPVKKIVFLTCITLSNLSAFSIIFLHKLPTETIANLSCHNTTTFLDVCSKNDGELPECGDSISEYLSNSSEPIMCQLFCEQNKQFWDEICESWNIKDTCITTNNTIENSKIKLLDVFLFTDQVESKKVLNVKSLKIEERQVQLPVCQKSVSTLCNIECTNDAIMRLATHPITKEIFALHEFWEFFLVVTLFWICQATIWSLQDSVCFTILGDKPENFGKQRCWGSISWGIFTISGGLLVDYFSKSDLEKNYDPVYYICLICILCNFAIGSKIKFTETNNESKIILSDIFKLFTKLNVIIYYIWIIVTGMMTSMVWNYLFWYMEDITIKYHSEKLPWIKTLQGFSIGIQSLGGEMLFMMFSGWIIKQFGHWNCMALGMFSFAFRFYLYSIITNPIWILPVEFLHGITFGLSFAVLVSYARMIAPKSGVSTLIGLSGAVLEGVGVSVGGVIGGILYDRYQGAQTFRLFSYGSLAMCILLIIYITFIKSNEHGEGVSKDQQLNEKKPNLI